MKRMLIPAGLVVGGVAAAVLLFEIVLRVAGFSVPIWYRPRSARWLGPASRRRGLVQERRARVRADQLLGAARPRALDREARRRIPDRGAR
jgi:hypothetical protein